MASSERGLPCCLLGIVETATKLATKKLARRYLDLVDDIDELDTHLAPLVRATAPALVAQLGIGVQSAAQLLVTAGDNPQRLPLGASFFDARGTLVPAARMIHVVIALSLAPPGGVRPVPGLPGRTR